MGNNLILDFTGIYAYALNASDDITYINQNVPFYISIDKDVLSKSYAVTNWNQGRLSIMMLEKLLKLFLSECEVIGVDICGEYSVAGGRLPEYFEADKINRKTDQTLYEYIHSFLS